MERLVEALEAKLAEADVRTASPASSVQPADTGGWLVASPEGGSSSLVHGDAVVLAPPAPVAADLLADVASAASRLLAGIEYAPVVVVTLAFARSDVTISLDASGFSSPSLRPLSRRAPGPRPNGGSRRDRSSSGHPPAGMATIGRWSSPTTTWWTSSWAT